MRPCQILLLVLFCGMLSSATAQDFPRFEGFVALRSSIASGDFKSASNGEFGIGGNAAILYNPSKNSNFFQCGLEFGLEHFAKAKKEYQNYPYKITNTLFTMHGIGRFRVETEKPIKPYFDFLVGFKTIFTTTRYDQDLLETVFQGDEGNPALSEHTEGAFSYGIAPGLTVGKKSTAFDIRLAFLFGSYLAYYVPDSFNIDVDGNITFESKKVRHSNLIAPQIGLYYSFYF